MIKINFSDFLKKWCGGSICAPLVVLFGLGCTFTGLADGLFALTVNNIRVHSTCDDILCGIGPNFKASKTMGGSVMHEKTTFLTIAEPRNPWMNNTSGLSAGEQKFFAIESSGAERLTAAGREAERLLSCSGPEGILKICEKLFNQPGNNPTRFQAGCLLATIRGAAPVRVEVRSHAELMGLYGAYAPRNATGQPVIYLNEQWLHGGASPRQVLSVLLEEYGHHLDYLLNGEQDTPGDEGRISLL